jgi:hypothetical protein
VTPVPVVATESAYACLTWLCTDESYPHPPFRPGARNNGDFPHGGDPTDYQIPLSGPLEYVDADGNPKPGPYTGWADRGFGIKCLTDGIVDVEFYLTCTAVWMYLTKIQIRVNNISVAETSWTDITGFDMSCFATDLAVSAGDIIEGWISYTDTGQDMSVPSGVGAASREHLLVTGVMVSP